MDFWLPDPDFVNRRSQAQSITELVKISPPRSINTNTYLRVIPEGFPRS